MNTHPGRHKENPCVQQHSYYCPVCGELFAVDGDSHWRHPLSGKTFVCLYWPACSFTCYSRRLDTPDTEVLDTSLERGDTTAAELEHLYDYIAEFQQIAEEPDEGESIL